MPTFPTESYVAAFQAFTARVDKLIADIIRNARLFVNSAFTSILLFGVIVYIGFVIRTGGVRQ
jgi:hypothetical protein